MATEMRSRVGGDEMMMDGDGWSWIGGAAMMLFFWGGLAALIVFLVRGLGNRPSYGDGHSRGPDAREILEQRYARGEISEDELKERKKVLESPP